MSKSLTMRQAGHVAYMGQITNAYNYLWNFNGRGRITDL